MAGGHGGQFKPPGKQATTEKVVCRRVWNSDEEQELANALKDLVQSGYKADNGFKTGYMIVLENALKSKFPNCNLRADPHILSKLHVWRKNYSSISTMLSRSGFGWNDSTKSVHVDSDEVWNNYVKTDSNARNMRGKPFPLFDDWEIIFGKDRATGENAEDLDAAHIDVVREKNAAAEAATSTKKRGKEKVHESIGDFDGVSNNMAADEEDESMETNNCAASVGCKTGSSLGKRKYEDEADGDIVGIISQFMVDSSQRLDKIAMRMGFQHDVSNARKQLFNALGNIGMVEVDRCNGPQILNLNQKIVVAKHLVHNTEDLDLFFSLDLDGQAAMVKMILDGDY